MTCKYKVKIKDIQYNYKVQMTDIQSKYKFKVFCTGYDDSEIKDKIDAMYEAWPKASGEGETITLNDTANTTMAINLKGNTSQVQYTGKNLFNYIDNLQTPYRGLTSTINEDGSITTTGIPQYNYTSIIGYDITSQLENGQEYTLSQNTKQANKLYLQINIVDNNGGATQYASLNNATSVSFTADTTNKKYIINLQTGPTANWGSSSLTITNYYQLEKGSSATSFEPYVGGIPSPNPNYPQDIHIVSGDNSVNVVGKNLFNKDFHIINGSFINGSGVIASDSTLSYQDYFIEVEQNTDYTISSSVSTIYRIAKYDSSKNFINRPYNENASTSYTINTGNAKYIKMAGTLTTALNSLQIEKGSTATTYEPYQGNTYPVNLPIENLFDKGNANTLNCFVNGSNGIIVSSNDAKSLYIPIQSSKTYTISKILSARFVVGTCVSTPANGVTCSVIREDRTGTSITITSGASDKFLCVYYYLSGSDTLTEQQILDSIQIEVGSKANSFTPYGTTPIELCKIGTYQDKIYKDSDKWYLHKEIGKKVASDFTSSKIGTASQGFYFIPNSTNVMADKTLKVFSKTQTWKNETDATWNTLDGGYIGVLYNVQQIYINKSDTIANIISWLNTINFEMYYVLATPTNTEITDSTLISQLNALAGAKSYSGQTNISQTNDDKPFILTAKALKDLSNL